MVKYVLFLSQKYIFFVLNHYLFLPIGIKALSTFGLQKPLLITPSSLFRELDMSLLESLLASESSLEGLKAFHIIEAGFFIFRYEKTPILLQSQKVNKVLFQQSHF